MFSENPSDFNGSRAIHYPIILLAAGLFLLLAGCGDKTVKSVWTSRPIHIDGVSNDWQDIPLHYNEDLKLVYGISNDATHLNLMIRFQDQRLARKINSRGVFFWLDARGKKSKDWGIRYLDEYAKTLENERLMSARENPDFRQNTMPDSRGEVRLNGSLDFMLDDEVRGPVSETGGVEAAAGFADGNYCFEFRIPLNKKIAAIRLPEILPGQTVKAGLEIGAVDAEVRQAVKERIEDEMRARGEQGGGMQMGAGRNPGGQTARAGGPDLTGFRDSMLKNLEGRELWMSVQLANKQP